MCILDDSKFSIHMVACSTNELLQWWEDGTCFDVTPKSGTPELLLPIGSNPLIQTVIIERCRGRNREQRKEVGREREVRRERDRGRDGGKIGINLKFGRRAAIFLD